MSTLNQLSSSTTLTSSDQIILYSTVNGSGRKASLNTLLSWIESAWMSPAFQRVTASPTLAGFTLALPTTASSLFVLLTPTGPMATGTIVLPAAASAADGQEIVLYSSQEVTALTFSLNGATALNGAPTGIQLGASLTLRYDVLSLAWYTTEKPTSVGSGTTGFLPKWTGPTTLGNSIVRDNGTEAAVGGVAIVGQKLAVYGNQFNISSDADIISSVVNTQSAAPRSVVVEAANFTDGAAGTAGFRTSVARGNLLFPAAVLAADTLGSFSARAYDGAGFFDAARIKVDATTNWAATRSSTITFSTSSAGTVADRLLITPGGDVRLLAVTTAFDASGTGQGIRLPSAPASSDVNVLDAYQEGTFTPVYNGVGIVGIVSFGGRYQRVGNQVTLEITISTAPASSLTFTSATDYFDNFPAYITPTANLITGTPIGDGFVTFLFKNGALFRAFFQKPAVATFVIPASNSTRYMVATYFI
jgi:hypothetical protein